MKKRKTQKNQEKNKKLKNGIKKFILFLESFFFLNVAIYNNNKISLRNIEDCPMNECQCDFRILIMLDGLATIQI